MTRHGALKDTVARAAHYGAMAKDALGIFTEQPGKARADRGRRFLHPARPLKLLTTQTTPGRFLRRPRG